MEQLIPSIKSVTRGHIPLSMTLGKPALKWTKKPGVSVKDHVQATLIIISLIEILANGMLVRTRGSNLHIPCLDIEVKVQIEYIWAKALKLTDSGPET